MKESSVALPGIYCYSGRIYCFTCALKFFGMIEMNFFHGKLFN